VRGPNEAICPRDGAYLGQGYTSACGEAQVPRMRKRGTRKCLQRPVGYNMRNASRTAFSSKGNQARTFSVYQPRRRRTPVLVTDP
jgi:hypothetical protein